MISKVLFNIASDVGLLPVQCHPNNEIAAYLSIEIVGTKFSEIWMEIQQFSLRKCFKWQNIWIASTIVHPFFLGNAAQMACVWTGWNLMTHICVSNVTHHWFWYWLALVPWWRHQMETFSALLAICAGNSPVTGEIPTQGPVTRSFGVFFDLRLN